MPKTAALTRYAAFLRGVMPINLNMAQLRAALEKGGFKDVRTVLASGNAVFSAAPADEEEVAERVERALEKGVGRRFPTMVRTVDDLRALLESDPYRRFEIPPGAKRVVTFLRSAPGKLSLPVERDGARIHAVRGREAFSSYTATPKGPVFMVLIEKTLGKDVTTRTWETLVKVAR